MPNRTADRLKTTSLVLGAATAATAALVAARRVAGAPPDLEVAARAEADAHRGPWTHGHATVNGVRLHYAEIGQGPLVILLHGFPECWYEWRHVMTALAPYFHVVAPDMRGYNESDKPAGVSSYSLDKLAGDIIGLIESFGEERAHVVGHDWGGMVAWRLGSHYPERVNRLVIINAPHPARFMHEIATSKQALRSAYSIFFQLPVLPEAAMRLAIRQALPLTAAIPGAFSDEALDIYDNSLSQPGAATAMLNYYRAAFRYGPRETREHERTVEPPTLVIWGMKDFALSPRLIEDLAQYVPNLQVERVEESGHWVPEEKPRLVSDTLIRFLQPGTTGPLPVV